jgi:hypothetical protein
LDWGTELGGGGAISCGVEGGSILEGGGNDFEGGAGHPLGGVSGLDPPAWREASVTMTDVQTITTFLLSLK